MLHSDIVVDVTVAEWQCAIEKARSKIETLTTSFFIDSRFDFSYFSLRIAAIFLSIFRFSASRRAMACSGVSISLFGTARTALANRLKRPCGESLDAGRAGIILRGMDTFSVNRNSAAVNSTSCGALLLMICWPVAIPTIRKVYYYHILPPARFTPKRCHNRIGVAGLLTDSSEDLC